MGTSNVFLEILWSYWPALATAGALLVLSVFFREQRTVYAVLGGIGITITVVVVLITLLIGYFVASLSI
jgi:hypothetical protein